jgi:hypothetical protein
MLEPACAAAGNALEQVGTAAAVPDATWTDPRDLVACAIALLANETEVWQLRQRTDLLPGSRR